MIKICQSCGMQNSETELLCTGCGADISAVLAHTPKAAEPPKNAVDTHKAPPESAPNQPTGSTRTDKISCPKCGASNFPFLPLCQECGAELPVSVSDNLPPPSSTQPVRKSSGEKLWLLAGGERVECQSGDILGREGTVGCEIFAGIDTVSRQHLSVVFASGAWQITPLSANKTWLNGLLLVRGNRFTLSSGKNELRLSTRCMVALEVE